MTGVTTEMAIKYFESRLESAAMPGARKAFSLALSALRERSEAETPLTLEELEKMGGKPVWIVEYPKWGHWELSECGEDYLEDRDPDFYGMTAPESAPDPLGKYGLHALGWLAYKREPEVMQDGKSG